MLENLENKLNYSFSDKKLLLTAVTHPSASATNYERLEFLGDAVLELSVSELLFTVFPDENEGYLTKLRSKIVCGNSLVKFAESINLGDYLILGDSEIKNNGRYRKSILENVTEAIFGAIFLDSDYSTVKSIIYRFISLKDISDTDDYKSQLQELFQSKHLNAYNYALLNESGPDHKKQFVIGLMLNGKLVSKGSGFSKKEAEKNAAKNYLLKHRE